MEPIRNPNLFRIGAGLATIYLVWGSTYLAIRIAVDSIPPFMMAGSRFLVAGVAMAFVLRWFRRFDLTRRQWFDSAIVAAFMLLGGNGLVCWAEVSIPSGVATLIVALNPIFFVMAEWLIAWTNRTFKSSRGSVRYESATSQKNVPAGRPKALTFVGLALGSLGLIILVGPSFAKGSDVPLQVLPVLAVIAACLCWTIGSLHGKHSRNAAEPFAGSAALMICGGIELIVVSLLLGEHNSFSPRQISLGSFLAWLYLVVAGSLIAFTTFVWLMKHSSPTLVATYAYVNPIVAVFLGWLFLGERINANLALASAFIVLGVALITVSKQRQ